MSSANREWVQLVPPEFLPGDWASDSARMAAGEVSEDSSAEPKPISGLTRLAFVVAGLGFVGIAYLGVIVPGLPATPWVLLASYCFSRSSPRLQRWLWRSPFFGKLLQDWYRHRGMRVGVKATAATMVTLACTVSILFPPIPLWVRFCIGCCGFAGLCVILFIVPTIRERTS